MNKSLHTVPVFSLLVCAAAMLTLGAFRVNASPILIGDFSGPPITYADVTADDGDATPPINWGTPGFAGTELAFAPLDFRISRTGGRFGALVAPITFEVIAAPGVGIDFMSLSLLGSYSFEGEGSTDTTVIAKGSINVTVDEIDGTPVTPFDLFPTTGLVGFNSTGSLDGPWNMILTLSVKGQFDFNAVPYVLGATRLTVSMTPSLESTTEDLTTASMQIDELKINAGISENTEIPEPATIFLCGAALALVAIAKRRTRRHA